jgi:TrmH family RNA methyltransferase
MITSIANEKVKYVRSLHRRRTRQRERHFIIEGVRLIGDALRAGVVPALVFYAENAPPLLEKMPGSTGGIWSVSTAVMKTISETVTPQGVLAVVPFIELVPPSHPWFILVVDGVRHPGNLGTILRSAEAAGVEWAIVAPETVDVYNPKVVRGAMGAHFRLPISALSWPRIKKALEGRPVFLASPRGESIYHQIDWTVPTALIVGGEAEGAGRGAERLADGRIAIPMQGGAESLNVAMATTVILFEAARQRANFLDSTSKR